MHSSYVVSEHFAHFDYRRGWITLTPSTYLIEEIRKRTETIVCTF